MRKQKIALIACSNGYGHVKRLLSISEAFKNKGITPTIFAQKAKVKKLSQILKINPPLIHDFDTRSDIKYQVNPKSKSDEWIFKLPSLNQFDHVISDNLLEILKIRKDAWISGSFFWHESLKNYPPNKKKYYKDLINKIKTRVVSSSLFTPNYMNKNSNLFEIGLFSFEKNKKNEVKENLLISCGKGGDLINETKKFIRLLLNEKSLYNYNKIFIEPSLYKTKMPSQFLPASYDNKMYSSLKTAIIRPGVGTLTDCIINSVPIFCYYEKNNLEMKLNAEKVEKFGLGENSKTIEKAWNQIKISNNLPKRQFFKSDCFMKINLNGAKDLVQIILEN